MDARSATILGLLRSLGIQLEYCLCGWSGLILPLSSIPNCAGTTV